MTHVLGDVIGVHGRMTSHRELAAQARDGGWQNYFIRQSFDVVAETNKGNKGSIAVLLSPVFVFLGDELGRFEATSAHRAKRAPAQPANLNP